MGAAAPSYIYECSRIDKKQETKSHRKGTEEFATVAEQIDTEQSYNTAIEVMPLG